MRVDFARLGEEHLSITDELACRGIWPVSESDDQWEYQCPLPGHEGFDLTFTVHTDEHTWECADCGQSGTLVDLIMLLDQVDLESAMQAIEDTVGAMLGVADTASSDLDMEPMPVPVSVKDVTPLQLSDEPPDESADGHSDGLSDGLSEEPSVESSDEASIPMTLESICAAKKLDVAFLMSLGCTDAKIGGQAAVSVPYYDEAGQTRAVRYWFSTDGRLCRWRKSDKPYLYGLDRLASAREKGWILVVSGEADCWACWRHGVPAISMPEGVTWSRKWAEHLVGLQVYIWQARPGGGLMGKMVADFPELRVIPAPAEIGGISDAHVAGVDVVALIDDLRAAAQEAGALLNLGCEHSIDEVRARAASMFEADDPLELVKDALREQDYGGDLDAAVFTYLACTGRVLAFPVGAMPAHLLLLGSTSSGKSWTEKVVFRLMPPEAYHRMPASSPKVLIYDDERLENRVVIMGESDSLPAGEDNPAASAMRSMLQDHHLHYDVVVQDPQTGDFVVRHVRKPGPTTLITTSVRRLGDQLDTRFFVLEVPEDHEQIASVLRAEAKLELEGGPPDPAPALVAYQLYLQLKAPWDVIVPFADQLAEHLAAQPVEGRVIRDFPRLLTLIKAVAVLRHEHRKRNAQGRLVAEPEDYAVVYELVGDVYRSSSTGAGDGVRAVVQAVHELRKKGWETITATMVAQHLGWTKMAASRRVRAALKGGWLTNCETRKGYPYHLGIGEPLPPETGLLPPEDLKP